MAADGRLAPPVFSLYELRRACVMAFLRGQAHRDDDRLPEYPMPDEIDRIVQELLLDRRAKESP